MRSMGRLLMTICAIVVMATAATAQRNVSVEGVSRVTHLSTSGMNLWVEVDNRGCSALVVKSGEVDVMVEGRHLVTISLRDKVVVPRRLCGEILLPLRFRARSSFVLSSLVRRIAEGDSEGVTISYRIRAGNRLIRKNIAKENVAVEELLNSVANSQEFIVELQQIIE